VKSYIVTTFRYEWRNVLVLCAELSDMDGRGRTLHFTGFFNVKLTVHLELELYE
jgi:hypothetical protein